MGPGPQGQAYGPSEDVHTPICTCSPSCSKSSRFVFIIEPYLVPQINGFVHFFREQIAKEIMYHVVFRTTTTCRIRIVLADLDSATFRSAPYPPIDTLALLGSTVSAFDSPDPGYSLELSSVLSSPAVKAPWQLAYRRHHAQLSDCQPGA